MNITVIDNYDSFVYNLVDYMCRHEGVKVKVYRNDRVPVSDVLGEKPVAILVSPGPGRPEDAGICVELIKKTPPDLPLLGVCLGHQAIGCAFGAKIVRAKNIFHGKTSRVSHDGKGLFKGLKNPLQATRYHSLALEEASLGKDFKITARSDDGEVMGIRHRKRKLYGVQFHPESILTEEGLKFIKNFVDLSAGEEK